jgi:uncharacterized membrane protein YcfT
VADTAVAKPAGSSRLQWVDAARGVCVVLVVLYHVGLLTYEPFRSVMWPPVERGWFAINALLAAMRMPLLRAISGLLAARWNVEPPPPTTCTSSGWSSTR